MSDDPHLTQTARQAPPVERDVEGIPRWLPRPLRAVLALPNDNPRKTLAVALLLCLICSVVVAGAAVLLKPVQEANQALDRKKNILAVAGLLEPGVDVESAFSRIEARRVNLDTGTFVDGPGSGAPLAGAAPSELVGASKEAGRVPRTATVYLIRDGERLEQLILPVHGPGLWSTLYGFLSLEGDLDTVAGLRFYEHAETPGLGGEVDNPQWRRKWRGKSVYGEQGEVRLEVVKGAVDPSREGSQYKVDGIAGATLTSRGVSELVRRWLGDQGFGKFIDNLRSGNT